MVDTVVEIVDTTTIEEDSSTGVGLGVQCIEGGEVQVMISIERVIWS